MFTIPGVENANEKQIPVVEFGDGTDVWFTLPVLGAKGVPMGLMNAVMLLIRARESNAKGSEQYVTAWAYFIDVLADNYPTATRHLASIDEEQFEHVITHWFEKSKELGGFDPKAQTS